MGALVGRTAGVGQFLAWDGGCLFIGRHDSELPVHHHRAIQLVVGTGAGFLVRAGDNEPLTSYAAALIPSRHPHGLDVTTSDYGAVILIEPETREGRALSERFLRDGIADVATDAIRAATGELFEAWLAQRGAPVIVESTRAIIRILTDGIEPSNVTDERILRAITHINENLTETLTLDSVAAQAYLSPSRFRHLFAEQTGMGLRPYILWRRFLRIWDLMMAGESLSTAAHSAGFADAAHLTRTSYRNFGFPP